MRGDSASRVIRPAESKTLRMRERSMHENREIPAVGSAGRRRGDVVAEADWLTELTAGRVCSWAEFLAGPHDPGLAAAMRRCENTGRPLGETTFLGKLEALLGRTLLPRRPGRPPKARKHYGVPRLPRGCSSPSARTTD